ncbi:hypothetical protein ACRAQ7_00815 [Erythrobacter sp. W53]|uniref:hypothetical protein n=1 Tax=Erythrobacter sp. W53 TaxID=3425947 RepID=UPI003D7677FD
MKIQHPIYRIAKPGFVAGSLFAMAIAAPANAEGVPAGTLIDNVASASFDGGSGTETVDSNTVEIRVDELLDVTLTSLDPGPIATGPGSAVLTFEVTNTGNGPEAFTLTTNPAVTGNDFDVTIDNIAIDTNGNGTYDPGVDTILTAPETTPVIAADANETVFVLVTVPTGVTDGDTSDVELTAEATTGTGAPGTIFAGQGVGGGDAIVGTTGADATATGSLVAGVADVTLVKSAIVTDQFGGTSAVPGATITYSIVANVTGGGSVSTLSVSDAFPTGTTYTAGTLTLDTGALTDASGDDAGEASATGITVDLGTVNTGTSHTITFDVVID